MLSSSTAKEICILVLSKSLNFISFLFKVSITFSFISVSISMPTIDIMLPLEVTPVILGRLQYL